MPVPTTRDDLNVTESLNSPAGSEAIGTSLDDYIRSHAAIIKQYVTDVADGTSASKGSSLVGFLQSGTGATARTVQSKLRDFLSVKDFGAVGDGATDDTSAIQLALDAAKVTVATSSARGRSVYFPAGDYKITDALVWNARDVDIVGEGLRTTIRQTVAGKQLLVIQGQSSSPDNASGNVNITNINLIHDDAANVSSNVIQLGGTTWATNEDNMEPASNPQPVTGLHLRGVWIFGGNYGVHGHRAFDCSISDCYFEGQSAYAIRLRSCGRIAISPCVYYSVGSVLGINDHPTYPVATGDNSKVISMTGGTAMIVERGIVNCVTGQNCSFVGLTAKNAGRRDPALSDQSGYNIGAAAADIIIANNVIKNHLTLGLKMDYAVDITAGATNVSIIGNSFDDNLYRDSGVLGDVIRENGTNPIRIANDINSAYGKWNLQRFINATSRIVSDNSIDLKAQSRSFFPRTSAAPSGLNADEVCVGVSTAAMALFYVSGTLGTLGAELTNVSADRGDSSNTITVGSSQQIQRFNTPLTAIRTQTCSATNSYRGARLRFVRQAGATGAFNLNVANHDATVLKSLTAAGQWCEVHYDGTNWFLSAAGSL